LAWILDASQHSAGAAFMSLYDILAAALTRAGGDVVTIDFPTLPYTVNAFGSLLCTPARPNRARAATPLQHA